ncbi:MAG: DUF47 domain-containing protein [Planctomycetota bacterium]|jgi:predicted phosphate transport protein (TIGR00153 family)
MRQIKLPLFGRTKDLAGRIDEFLDQVSEAGMVLEQGILSYLDHGYDDSCSDRLARISRFEARGDTLRRGIQTTLYTEMLIPEWRGDVLRLLSELDRLLNVEKASFKVLSIERPEIPDEYKDDLRELTKVVANSIEHVVYASRAYFHDISAMHDHVHKTCFYESEADEVMERLKERVYRSDLPLARKMQLRDAASAIDSIADQAEDVADSLAIYAIKRAL